MSYDDWKTIPDDYWDDSEPPEPEPPTEDEMNAWYYALTREEQAAVDATDKLKP